MRGRIALPGGGRACGQRRCGRNRRGGLDPKSIPVPVVRGPRAALRGERVSLPWNGRGTAGPAAARDLRSPRVTDGTARTGPDSSRVPAAVPERSVPAPCCVLRALPSRGLGLSCPRFTLPSEIPRNVEVCFSLPNLPRGALLLPQCPYDCRLLVARGALTVSSI